MGGVKKGAIIPSFDFQQTDDRISPKSNPYL